MQIAVAANFAQPARLMAAEFERATGHQAQLAIGGTGKFYAQIRNDAPFEVLLAADDTTPAKLEAEGLGSGRFVYATGRLALWSAKPGFVDAQGDVLKEASFRHLAIASPKLAPYGVAAIETLTALQLHDRLQRKLVFGENIGQTHQFVASGNAELGFVALSQVVQDGRIASGSGWIVPTELHSPLRQEALLLNAGKDHPAAVAWLAYLRSDKAKTIIRAFGYAI